MSINLTGSCASIYTELTYRLKTEMIGVTLKESSSKNVTVLIDLNEYKPNEYSVTPVYLNEVLASGTGVKDETKGTLFGFQVYRCDSLCKTCTLLPPLVTCSLCIDTYIVSEHRCVPTPPPDNAHDPPVTNNSSSSDPDHAVVANAELDVKVDETIGNLELANKVNVSIVVVVSFLMCVCCCVSCIHMVI